MQETDDVTTTSAGVFEYESECNPLVWPGIPPAAIRASGAARRALPPATIRKRDASSDRRASRATRSAGGRASSGACSRVDRVPRRCGAILRDPARIRQRPPDDPGATVMGPRAIGFFGPRNYSGSPAASREMICFAVHPPPGNRRERDVESSLPLGGLPFVNATSTKEPPTATNCITVASRLEPRNCNRLIYWLRGPESYVRDGCELGSQVPKWHWSERCPPCHLHRATVSFSSMTRSSRPSGTGSDPHYALCIDDL